MATFTATTSRTTANAKISQLSCYSSINRHGQLLRRTFFCPMVRLKSSVVMSLDSNRSETTVTNGKTSLTYAANEVSDPSINGETKLYAGEGEIAKNNNELAEGSSMTQQKGGAKIHDFCFGIPYGGVVLSGGLIGSIFSRNLSTLGTGVFFGGALLAFSMLSLKVWRQGKSSLPFILGQAVLSAILLWKNFKAFSLVLLFTFRISCGSELAFAVFLAFAFAAFAFGKRARLTQNSVPNKAHNLSYWSSTLVLNSAAMLCFYTYVVLSGGNPPPKKLQSSATSS